MASPVTLTDESLATELNVSPAPSHFFVTGDFPPFSVLEIKAKPNGVVSDPAVLQVDGQKAIQYPQTLAVDLPDGVDITFQMKNTAGNSFSVTIEYV